jgi:hypothetical protein
VTHGTQVVDFLRLDLGNDGDEIGGVAQVTVMQKELDSTIVTILVDVLDTPSVERRGTTDDTMDLKEKESKVSQLGYLERNPSIDPRQWSSMSQASTLTSYPFSSNSSAR